MQPSPRIACVEVSNATDPAREMPLNAPTNWHLLLRAKRTIEHKNPCLMNTMSLLVTGVLMSTGSVGRETTL